MKPICTLVAFSLALGLSLSARAQSTTGGRSGGSTASTGTGYLTEGKRTAETSASSMTIADEGASRDYMYVPPTKTKNRSASPDGSGDRTKPKLKPSVGTTRPERPKKPANQR